MISISFLGCATKQSPPPNYPDYSSPEATFWTQFYALQTRDHKILLSSLTESYQNKYGNTKEEQLSNFQKYAKKMKIPRNRKRDILKVEYGNFGDYDVKITWSEKIGSKYSIRKSYMVLKKINNEWKIAYPETEEKQAILKYQAEMEKYKAHQ